MKGNQALWLYSAHVTPQRPIISRIYLTPNTILLQVNVDDFNVLNANYLVPNTGYKGNKANITKSMIC